MLTLQTLIDKKKPLDEVLSDQDKKELREENKGKNYSYLCLMNEMFGYRHMTPRDLLNGWGGVKLFTT